MEINIIEQANLITNIAMCCKALFYVVASGFLINLIMVI